MVLDMVLKRPASGVAARASKGSAAKKARVSKKPVDKQRAGEERLAIRQCAEVVAALGEAQHLPGTTASTLVACAKHGLLTYKEERHEYQNALVEMVGETLRASEAALVKAIEEAEVNVQRFPSEKIGRESAVVSAEGALTRLEEAVPESIANLKAAELAVSAEEKTTKAALEAQRAGDEESQACSDKKEQLEAVLLEAFVPLKDGLVDRNATKKKLLLKLGSVGGKHGLPKSMLEALRWALGESSETRVDFDNLILAEFENAWKKRIEALVAEMATAEPGRAERASAVETARAAQMTAQEARDASKISLSEARASLKQGTRTLAKAKASLNGIFYEFQQAADSLDTQKMTLEQMRTGPLAAFTALKELAAPPVPEEPIDPEKANEMAVLETEAALKRLDEAVVENSATAKTAEEAQKADDVALADSEMHVDAPANVF